MHFRLVRFLSAFLSLSVILSFTSGAQEKHESYALTVNGEVEKPLQLSLSEFSKMPRRTVRAKNHDGKECGYEGVELREVLGRAGVTFGDKLKGKLLASFVLVEAADKYQVVFALPELDALFSERVILLADTCDGKPLPATNGPLQIIVPDEKRHSRWVRQVTLLTVMHAEKKTGAANK